ncbi:4-demethylwyosine synthase TYW1 [Thermococcus thioreducens]|uniref:S-adenosyl-L-methionine-dependent tRNA 4-demethylwyosine synthase n=1 Tax=Thermococcus thioreducens TaxID=277988 RepID=A0A0Q2M3T5_9EURY|nr:4-demethylwyosine synthase TYW1 [Thermococcus thioreducens]ASJ11644.1 wyosine biosynthesis protein TYW1 [Thermococcus thioreducens]KQH82618.1 tRNA-modifying protein [Thermococcus thioreducens]SEW16367.1 tRNA wybutosine-synthesizing protein 1 [Thermococcus thioreducens]
MALTFKSNPNMPEEIARLFKKQHYALVGRHSSVKLCHWLKESIKKDRFCYKQKFYGIHSHRCLQMTPVTAWCSHNCIFCWRPMEGFLGTELPEPWDDPAFIVEESIKAQRKLLVGYKGMPGINMKKFEEAWNPKHAAISLSGEPMLYPYMGDLVEEFHKRGFTTFIVTNGTVPERLEEMIREDKLPTQLYVSLTAPDIETYKGVNVPMIPDGWDKIKEFLRLMGSADTRTVVRLTLVKGENMHNPEGYAKLIKLANPMFVEAKAYMFVGFSRNRLTINNMPRHEEIRAFAEELVRHLPGYHIEDEYEPSRVVLIMRDDVDSHGSGREGRFIGH